MTPMERIQDDAVFLAQNKKTKFFNVESFNTSFVTSNKNRKRFKDDSASSQLVSRDSETSVLHFKFNGTVSYCAQLSGCCIFYNNGVTSEQMKILYSRDCQLEIYEEACKLYNNTLPNYSKNFDDFFQLTFSNRLREKFALLGLSEDTLLLKVKNEAPSQRNKFTYNIALLQLQMMRFEFSISPNITQYYIKQYLPLTKQYPDFNLPSLVTAVELQTQTVPKCVSIAPDQVLNNSIPEQTPTDGVSKRKTSNKVIEYVNESGVYSKCKQKAGIDAQNDDDDEKSSQYSYSSSSSSSSSSSLLYERARQEGVNIECKPQELFGIYHSELYETKSDVVCENKDYSKNRDTYQKAQLFSYPKRKASSCSTLSIDHKNLQKKQTNSNASERSSVEIVMPSSSLLLAKQNSKLLPPPSQVTDFSAKKYNQNYQQTSVSGLNYDYSNDFLKITGPSSSTGLTNDVLCMNIDNKRRRNLISTSSTGITDDIGCMNIENNIRGNPKSPSSTGLTDFFASNTIASDPQYVFEPHAQTDAYSFNVLRNENNEIYFTVDFLETFLMGDRKDLRVHLHSFADLSKEIIKYVEDGNYVRLNENSIMKVLSDLRKDRKDRLKQGVFLYLLSDSINLY